MATLDQRDKQAVANAVTNRCGHQGHAVQEDDLGIVCQQCRDITRDVIEGLTAKRVKPPIFDVSMVALTRKMHKAIANMMAEIGGRRSDSERMKGDLSIVTRADLYDVQQSIRRMLGVEDEPR